MAKPPKGCCTCVSPIKITFSPGGSTFKLDQRESDSGTSVRIGNDVQTTFETTGDPAYCTCKITEKGTSWAAYYGGKYKGKRFVQKLDKELTVDCTTFTDALGAYISRSDPGNFGGKIKLSFNISSYTVQCTDSSGKTLTESTSFSASRSFRLRKRKKK